ncbi:MAG TPA: polysaccharide biosynthesis C-terminal domain-containing protein [Leadbetterella sp.]|jgi:O-antigen/teichoic acid export membrane protein|nr:polysaccharide biosynthesis C-terminal domain-containing protein [Leadbetterella sp.]
MGIIINQGLKNSIGFYLGVVLGAVNILFVSTYFLSANELAISRLLVENSFVLAAFAHLGAPHILDRFFWRFKDDGKGHNGVLMYLLLFPHIGIIILTIIYFVFRTSIENYFSSQSPSLIPYIWLTLPLTYFWTLFVIFDAYLRVHKSTFYPTFLKETFLRLVNIGSIVLYGFQIISFDIFIYLQLFAVFIVVLLLIINIGSKDILFIDFKYLKIDSQLLKQTMQFGAVVIFGGIGANLIQFIDRNIIAHKIGTQATAIFMISTYLASFIEIPVKSIKQISMPFLSEYFTKSDTENIENLYNKASHNFILLAGLMFVLVFFNIEYVLHLLPKSEIYLEGKWIVIIITGGKCLEMSLGLNNEVIAFSKYYKFNTYLILIMMICIVLLNYLLIPIYGVLGSAIATAIVTIISSLVRMFYVKIKFGFEPFTLQKFKIFLMFVFIFLFAFFLDIFKFDDQLVSFVFMIVKVFAVISLFTYFTMKFNFSPEFREALKHLSKKL